MEKENLPEPADHKHHTRHEVEVIDNVVEDILHGGKINEVARRHGVPRRTVFTWLKEKLAERRELQDILFVDRMEKIGTKILAEIDTKDLQETSVRDLMVSLGILLDKRQNLTGPKQAAPGALNLRVAWKNGEGAVELTTGQPAASPPVGSIDDYDEYDGGILEPVRGVDNDID
ncbi:MAG: hypothetical protein A4E56_02648 [Pelotomaculum sp. PtaU1.Bin065]|nr:MAG: hypothetical protein A4E56_02648 [Pelotomaculum sp. PtaU1.Bin065]